MGHLCINELFNMDLQAMVFILINGIQTARNFIGGRPKTLSA
jgi:hypothetical protein